MLFKRWMNNDNEDRSYEDKLSDIKELTANADADHVDAMKKAYELGKEL